MANLFADSKRIEQNLRTELERTSGLYRKARAHFRSVTREVPSGIPYLDNVIRITQAADNHNRALDAYKTALMRLNDYAIRKTIPNDLNHSAAQDLGHHQ